MFIVSKYIFPYGRGLGMSHASFALLNFGMQQIFC